MTRLKNQITLEEIWLEYQTALGRFLQSRVSNPADVEDLLQDILIKTHKNLHQVKSPSSIKSWIFQIANHAIIDFYRSAARQKKLEDQQLWYTEDQADVKKELIECLSPFINALPQDEASLLKSIELDNVAQKKYANDHGIKYSTLKSRVQKSRTELRQIFEACCHLSLDKQGNLIDYLPKQKNFKGCKSD